MKTLFVALLATGTAYSAVTISSTIPTVDDADIANLTWTTTTSDTIWNDRPNSLGQSFTTGSNLTGYTFSSVSFQVNSSATDANPARVYSMRVVEISGTDTTTVRYETIGHSSNAIYSAGDWFTFVLNTSLSLDPDKIYGIDVEHVSGGEWQDGIPSFRYNDSATTYTGGYRYTFADGDPSTLTTTSTDRVFHIDLATNAIPEPAVALLGGLGALLLLRRRRA